MAVVTIDDGSEIGGDPGCFNMKNGNVGGNDNGDTGCVYSDTTNAVAISIDDGRQ